jgi:hypothetical protein
LLLAPNNINISAGLVKGNCNLDLPNISVQIWWEHVFIHNLQAWETRF